MELTSCIVGGAVLLLFVGFWFFASSLLSPRLKDPDGQARLTGSCGDTMEIGFQLRQEAIVATHYWTDGCSTSQLCIAAAARLAENKTLEEAGRITMMDIIDHLGSLPESHLHCAQLAATTLQHALATCPHESADPPV